MVTVIGLGNILLKDEGFGVHLLRQLKEEDLSGVELIDGGCAGFNLLNLMRDKERVILLDVILSPSQRPGSLQVLTWEEVESLPPGRLVSAHQYGVKEALALARLTGRYPSYFRVLAAVPETISTGIGLSPPLEQALEAAREWLLQEIKRLRGR